MYYQAFDEDAQPFYGISQMAITLQDPSKIKLHTWHVGQTEDQINNDDSGNSHQTGEDDVVYKSSYNIPTNEEKMDSYSIENATQKNGKLT